MSHHWQLLITVSWLSSVSLQYINTGGPGADTVLDTVDAQYPLPYANYFNIPRNDYQNDAPDTQQIYAHDEERDLQRKRRTIDKEEVRDKRWQDNTRDAEKNYIRDQNVATPFVIGFTGIFENDTELTDPEKKSFSPWGGKRGKEEHMWTWKRAMNIREPSMPKRVRFSPWGGKRSGHIIYKPTKASKIIFSSTVPEVTRIVSNYFPTGQRFNLAGLKLIPILDKRHPIKILTLSTKMDERSLKEALPFKSFIDFIPKLFKPGHTYLDVNLKKDGKRKVKFSAWGGKRSPPIIGPIWTPSTQNIKDSTLDTILMIRNSEAIDATTKAK